MRAFNYFTLMALAVLSVACNEKISPKLLDANQSTTVPPVIEPEEYYFRVKNTSPDYRKFHLHKTGLGNFNTACETKSYNKFSSARFNDDSQRPTFDITCIFDAEELALEQKGFSFAFEASPNTCEYVGYSPFSFYNFKPGNSSATYTRIVCEDGATPAHVAADPDALRDANSQVVPCDHLILNDAQTAPGDALPFVLEGEETRLCAYDYSQNPKGAGPNCDVGEITINEIVYTLIPATEDDPIERVEKEVKVSPGPVKCGGKVSACIQGPIKEEERYQDHTNMLVLYETSINESFAQEREYGEAPRKFSNLFYTNFRRHLASPHIEFTIDNPTYDPIMDPIPYFYDPEAFRGATSYLPLLMENYAAGRTYSGRFAIPGLSRTDNEMIGGFPVKRRLSYAAEPFLGLTDEETGDSYRTSPYYTFYCLDSAREIRARIKMLVREWDQFFSTDRNDFDLISDIFRGDQGRIDNTDGIQVPGDHDPINGLNDIMDWDDLIPMFRTPGTFDPVADLNTIWRPSSGFHSRANFPEVTEDGEN